MMISAYSYYKSMFPFAVVSKMLTFTSDLRNREFAIEAQSYYKRYVRVDHPRDWPDVMNSHSTIQAVHVGPIYSGTVQRPSSNSKTMADDIVDCAFQSKMRRILIERGPAAAREYCLSHPTHEETRIVPNRKELFFDVDVTDYAPLGINKESLGDIDRYWKVTAFAIDVVHELLQTCFGYQQICVFYSGKKGAHIWVLDPAACSLTDEKRSEMFRFMTLSASKSRFACVQDSFLEHPIFSSLVCKCVSFLYDVGVMPQKAGGLGIFDSEDSVRDFVETLGITRFDYRGLADNAVARRTGLDRLKYIHARVKAGEAYFEKRFQSAVLSLVWPRLDATLAMSHLGKAPFCVHKSTNRIAVPIPIERIYDFNPENCPTLSNLLNIQYRKQLNRIVSDFDAHLDSFGPGLPSPVFRQTIKRSAEADLDPNDSYTIAEAYAKKRKLCCDASEIDIPASVVTIEFKQQYRIMCVLDPDNKRVYKAYVSWGQRNVVSGVSRTIPKDCARNVDIARLIVESSASVLKRMEPNERLLKLMTEESVFFIADNACADCRLPARPVHAFSFDLDPKSVARQELTVNRLAFKIGKIRIGRFMAIDSE